MGIVTLIYGLVLAAIALAADAGCLDDLLTHAHLIPLGDKAIHFTLVGLLALAVNVSIRISHNAALVGTIAPGSIVVAVAATIEECSNAWTPYRTCSLGDLAANYLGVVALGVLPLVIYFWWFDRGAHSPHLADVC